MNFFSIAPEDPTFFTQVGSDMPEIAQQMSPSMSPCVSMSAARSMDLRKTVKPSRRAPNLAATLAQRGGIARSHHRSGRVCVEVDPKQ